MSLTPYNSSLVLLSILISTQTVPDTSPQVLGRSIEATPLIAFADIDTEKPTFKSPEGQEKYDLGVASFSERLWKDADKAFKAARKNTADKSSKSHVDLFEKACSGGKLLDKVQKDIDKEKWRKAWSGLMNLEKKYGETPLVDFLKETRDVIYPELFLDLATFEEPPPEPEVKARAAWPENETRITKDPDVIFEGKGALQWGAGNTGGGAFGNFAFGRLPLASLEDVVVEDYRILNISIYNEDDNFGKYVLYFGPEPLGGVQAGGGAGGFGGLGGLLRNNCYSHYLTIRKKGWNHFRVDLVKDLKKDPNLTWTDILSLSLLTVPPSHKKTLVIDAVKLERL
ncbi:hypothetical protein OAN47_04030 [Planctomycetota bacterium]|nr:hypothetical protein [Planctomycetota bacterium]